jgi:hypothetical protein
VIGVVEAPAIGVEAAEPTPARAVIVPAARLADRRDDAPVAVGEELCLLLIQRGHRPCILVRMCGRGNCDAERESNPELARPRVSMRLPAGLRTHARRDRSRPNFEPKSAGVATPVVRIDRLARTVRER